MVDPSVYVYVDLAPFGERIYNRHSHAVQPAGDFVAFLVELSAGMQLCHDNFEGTDVFAGVNVNRNSTPIILYGDDVFFLQMNIYLRAVPGEGFIDAVIDYFVN
jgi:hypothetical protein